MSKTNFKKWTSIEKFSDAVIQAQRQFVKSIWYRPKVKLHGTNAGVRVEPNGAVAFQKRTSDITPTHDNMGFADFGVRVDWSLIARPYGGTDVTYIIWGEWAGPGTATGDAVCSIPEKTFFIFSVEVIVKSKVEGEPDTVYIVGEPKAIYDIVRPVVNAHPNKPIVVLPWADEPQLVRFFGEVEGSVSPNEYADYINGMVDRMEVRDDYIFEKYGVDRHGEGYVLYPNDSIDFSQIPRDVFGTFVFKAKTAAHSSGKTKGAKVKVDVPASFVDFADTFVTDSRCEQMIREHCEGVYSMQKTPDFLRALITDIEKESRNERDAGGVEMKDVQKLISSKAVNWLKKKTEMTS